MGDHVPPEDEQRRMLVEGMVHGHASSSHAHGRASAAVSQPPDRPNLATTFAIVMGSVIGGILLIIVVIVVYRYWRRRRAGRSTFATPAITPPPTP